MGSHGASGAPSQDAFFACEAYTILMKLEKKKVIVLGKVGIIVSLIILIFAFILPWYPSTGVTAGSCTAEAKICPDGSAVGRTGPDCTFDRCPNEQITFAITNGVSDVPKASTAEGLVVTCTADARSCPDGSFSLRLPPDCNFAPCE
ncbi:MAG: hypothetical protein A2845_01605 [Candidatus Lloydbacteria bacterium RIFCSPHIGHO2_01_FULL_49_22]|uniref:Uncharacterized protein n=1 Tax=Candidatus Lloydbacteria bacterium RIFCSPHIGHO2_01_FULL_49_22 TaxID=1798658 RepID=A0A1G2CY01_9BACT|nr:MAG: hypothetical protein A2845_01605 [Candidatus Lloydbacteria bacterium RIFCSPHIGHO2_01_FULL_49_22]OGZ09993.1 MAG: hypothetical protein A3C14_04770 [Candidatus Lloydbacteria bacterium RIFCSPHIGHO2_02_FULL_50_18]